MELDRYFERVGYKGGAAPTLETLTALHTAHVFAIPFENLDVFYGKPISLEPEALCRKLVDGGRGGYCFEMNGLFSLVLRELGFHVTDLLARRVDGGIRRAKTHQVLMIEIDGARYLADVGYGNNGIAAPLRLAPGEEQAQMADAYLITEDPQFGYVLHRREDGAFAPMYAFTAEECYPADFEVANYYVSTHPQSFFRAGRFCTKPTPSGRITLTEDSLKIRENGAATQRPVSEGEFGSLLNRHFGLSLDLFKEC
ncbi:MAG: arylamine N-acetyltransferase [Peptococcaceae bacterium]|jgi:N-hydroxyarylamine O-acetyltransferase|nr:arylamine N-acetyltransferase [Peptococcaceae bacterium]